MSHIANPSKYTRRYHPRHSLAKYIINQIELLELRPQAIVKKMGYPLKHTIPAYDRLRHVLSNKYLGLDGSYMDKYFTADEFLIKLFAVLEIPYQPFAEDIAQIKYDLAHHFDTLPKYSLRAEVDFTFTSADNWRSCGSASNFAQVHLPSGFAKLDDAARESVIRDSIFEHYQQYEGSLPYDGIIKGYRLTIEKSNHVVDHEEYGLPKSSSI
ncbi:hypothetical protein ACQKCF_09530 [Psychrobacter proteolyticus]|uniref:hypothetical protein n=1 Tax=Psychrobacter proteolyticus TaxID=147825 RepID=UPI003CFF2456